MSSEPAVPRVVKPRQPYRKHLPIIAVAPEAIYVESAGELAERPDLPTILREHPSALIACGSPHGLLASLIPAFASDPQWNFRLTPIEREKRLADGTTETRKDTLVSWLGFQRRNGRERSRHFYPLAPATFCRANVRDLIPEAEAPYWQCLFQWAEAVREFCSLYDLKPSPTSGGIAAQLLRHPDFYPEARRKVPVATNETAREYLPGNHYELAQREDVPVGSAIYIDQEDAHHSAAESIALPHADHLRARGRFHDPTSGRPWIRFRGPGWDAITRQYGLLALRVEVPTELRGRPWIPPYLTSPGNRTIFCFTSELSELEALGVRVRWAVAAWTSTERDRNLAKYASWARAAVRDNPELRGWLKPTLLASYGILAAKPRHLRSAYLRAKSGERENFYIGAERIELLTRQTKRQIQSPIANVIQRGMVEAETRRRSLVLARELAGRGFDVLAVYADAVMVRDIGTPLPLLDKPWRVKGRLSHLIFHSPQAFTSLEKSRLPGKPRSRMESSHSQSKERITDGNVRQGSRDRKQPDGNARRG